MEFLSVKIDGDRNELYQKLLKVARRKTRAADIKLEKHGKPIEEKVDDLGENTPIFDPLAATKMINGRGEDSE